MMFGNDRLLDLAAALNGFLDRRKLGQLGSLSRMRYRSLAVLCRLSGLDNVLPDERVSESVGMTAAEAFSLRKPQTVVVVLGMHRSGTSIATGILGSLGVYLGEEEELIGPNPYNELGHFENRHLVKLNAVILWRAGGSSMVPPARDRIMGIREFAKVQLRRVLQRYRERPIWGFKDPQTCLTGCILLPLLVEDPCIDPMLVVVSRDNEAVVRSLMRRDHLSADRAEALVARYLRELDDIQKSFQIPTHYVQYEDFFNSRASPISDICSFLGLSSSREALASAESLVKKELRHF